MPALTLPLTFVNSFWSEDYRTGLETIYGKLEQGLVEDDEIVAFIRARAQAERDMGNLLTRVPPEDTGGKGFSRDEGASLLMAFRGLQSETVAQGKAHLALGKELEDLVILPFNDWAQGHKGRIVRSRNSLLDGHLKAYEIAGGDVEALRKEYLSKTRRADEAEDDAKFAPGSDYKDNYTASPKLLPRESRVPQRTASVSERIAQRFKELQKKALSPSSTISEEPESEKAAGSVHSSPSKIDKGKGKAVDGVASPTHVGSPAAMSPTSIPDLRLNTDARSSSPQPLSPAPLLTFGDVSMPPNRLSELFKKAAKELPMQTIKVAVIGEYRDCFNGEDFVAWLKYNVEEFDNDLDKAEVGARDLVEKLGLLRRIGEFGNQFEHSDDAIYQIRPKAFELDHTHKPSGLSTAINTIASPVEQGLKRSNTFVDMVSKVITVGGNTVPFHVRAREEANVADKEYRVTVRKYDRQRLALEEYIEETLKSLQKWELERLRAVKTVLLQYQGTLASFGSTVQPSLDRSSMLITSYQPESDLKGLIERYRTGGFRPAPQVYESLTHDESDVYFGIDLRRWADVGWNGVKNGEERAEKVPPVLMAMLGALQEVYPNLDDDSERRKTWIYEVPLAAVHQLREHINGVAPGKPIQIDAITKYDAPVIASTVKLWALELGPPLGTWEGWEDFRKLYPHVGADSDEIAKDEEHLNNLRATLQKLPMVHLHVLDALFNHFTTLISSTNTQEPNDVYITKLALSLGRSLLRPKHETEMSIQDRHPTLLTIDLLTHYKDILPQTIMKKKRESDRRVPTRKRTAPIDMRMSRSRLSANIDPQEILAAQLAAKNPSMKPSGTRSPPATHLSPPANALSLSLSDAQPSMESVMQEADVKETVVPIPDFKEPPPEVDESLKVPAFKEPPPEFHEEETKPVITQSPSMDGTALPPPPAAAPAIPPPPPISSSPIPTFKEPPPETDDTPVMPAFKEPPPEIDDTPAPPAFKEPAPEPEDISRPPAFREPAPEPEESSRPPAFKEPPPEPADVPPAFKEPPPELESPPPPVQVEQPTTSLQPTPPASASESLSPSRKTPPGSGFASPSEDKPGANLSRSSSGETSSRLRGPRTQATRGPRPQSGSVASMVANMNRYSAGVSNGAGRPTSPPAGNRRVSLTGPSRSISPRPNSPPVSAGNKGIRRSNVHFQRRTMASDAEDELVEK